MSSHLRDARQQGANNTRYITTQYAEVHRRRIHEKKVRHLITFFKRLHAHGKQLWSVFFSVQWPFQIWFHSVQNLVDLARIS